MANSLPIIWGFQSLEGKAQSKDKPLDLAARERFILQPKENPMTLLSVPDMNCGHCKASVEAALQALPGAAPIIVDLANRQVTAHGAPEALIAALDQIGFPAQVLPST
jgi:copper chaperone